MMKFKCRKGQDAFRDTLLNNIYTFVSRLNRIVGYIFTRFITRLLYDSQVKIIQIISNNVFIVDFRTQLIATIIDLFSYSLCRQL